MNNLSQSEFNDILKRLSKVYLKAIIRGVGLKYKYEQVLWLIYIEELSYAEVSTQLNITRESVGNLVTKARKQLKYLIDKQGILLPEEIQQYLSIFNKWFLYYIYVIRPLLCDYVMVLFLCHNIIMEEVIMIKRIKLIDYFMNNFNISEHEATQITSMIIDKYNLYVEGEIIYV